MDPALRSTSLGRSPPSGPCLVGGGWPVAALCRHVVTLRRVRPGVSFWPSLGAGPIVHYRYVRQEVPRHAKESESFFRGARFEGKDGSPTSSEGGAPAGWQRRENRRVGPWPLPYPGAPGRLGKRWPRRLVALTFQFELVAAHDIATGY